VKILSIFKCSMHRHVNYIEDHGCTSIIKKSIGAQDSEKTTRWRENSKVRCMTKCDLIRKSRVSVKGISRPKDE
jgi:hypothetical protein